MPHLNLLPWREELRKRRQKEFAVIAGAAVLSMLGIVFLVHLQFNSMISYQKARNQFLEHQIVQLDKKIKEIKGLEEQKQRLLARMEIIQELQASRPEVVHLFDELVKTLPDGVYFTKVTQTGRKLAIEGVAQSNARVSSLMRQLDSSPWLENPILVHIKADSKSGEGELQRLAAFSLRISQAKQKDNKEGSS